MTDADPLVVDYALRFPDAFARVLAEGDDEEISALVHTLPGGSVAAVVSRLPASRLRALLESADHSPQAWLQDAPFDDAVMLLSRMRRERRLALIESIGNRARRQQLMRHERYPAHCVGSLVQDMLLRIDVSRTAKSVIDELGRLDGDDMPLLVVVGSNGRYAGVLNPWPLLSRRYTGRGIDDLVDGIPPIAPETPVTAAVANKGWLDRNWLPVVDNKGRVLGALSRRRLMRAASKQSQRKPGSGSLMLDLVGDLTLVLGDVVDGLLGGRGR